MPAKVLVNERAKVTAGFANDVDAVNQYAAVMYAPTANAVNCGCFLETPQITESSPNVATSSLKSCAGPLRTCCEAEKTTSPNIKCAAATPPKAPTTCATRYAGTS